MGHWIMAGSPRLFEHDLPSGFHYRDDFITEADERVLLDAIADVAFSDFEMRGVVARRRVAFFGQSYDRDEAGPLPAFLLPLRATIAQWAGVDIEAFAMALINEYRPGSPIGWHRDAPPVQHRRRRLVAIGMPDDIPSVPNSGITSAEVVSSIGDPRNCARASFGVSHDARVADGVRTSHPAGRRVALLGDVSYAPMMSGRIDASAPMRPHLDAVRSAGAGLSH